MLRQIVNFLVKDNPNSLFDFHLNGGNILQSLPKANSLREAVNKVIQSNKSDKYNPTRFIQLTAVNNDELVTACSKLIQNPNALPALFDAFQKHKSLLTIEDFVSVFGLEWGFSQEIIDEARTRSEEFDSWVKQKRFVS